MKAAEEMKREELNTPKMLRRVRLDLNTPAEMAIFKAMQEVEKAGADVRLTEATMLLAKAKDCVADFIDGVEQSIPPAEGAEEITAEEFIREKIKQKYGLSDEEMTGSLGLRCTCTGRDASKWAQEFATLRAQKIADKMVEDMRQKLFSMRATKKTMDMLSEADRLITYGYHDCINEMLMWTKSREK